METRGWDDPISAHWRWAVAERLLGLSLLLAGCLVPAPDWQGKGMSASAGTGVQTGGTSGASTGVGPGDGSDGGDGSGDGGGDDPTEDLPADCAALPPASDPVSLGPDDDLAAAVAALEPGATVVLADGTYPRAGAAPIVITADGVTLRSAGGDAEAVVLDGEGGEGPLIRVAADDVTIAAVTLRDAAVAVEVTLSGAREGPRLYRVAVRDVQRAVHGLTVAGADGVANRGVIACSSFAVSEDYRATPLCPQSSVVHVFGGAGWVVQDNAITGYFCAEGSAYATLVFDRGAADTVIRRNVFTDNHRSIVLGSDAIDIPAAMDGQGCGGSGWAHVRGRVSDNRFVVSDPALGASPAGVDSMISVWNGCGTEVYHNSIYTAFPPFSGIEWRFTATRIWLMNNLSNAPYLAREGAVALGQASNGVATEADFVDAAAGDLRLAPGSAAIDAGAPVPVEGLQIDALGTLREGPPDFGAVEFTN